jgi:hypothetical protein
VLRDAGIFVASGLALGVLALGTWRVSTKETRDIEGRRRSGWATDLLNVRDIVGLVAFTGRLPMRDGAFDPYDLLRTGDMTFEQIKVLRSERLGIGPTEEEIRRGDYTNFPWERYRGDPGRPRTPPFPLLWEREPLGRRIIVGFSDGTAFVHDREELVKWGLAR